MTRLRPLLSPLPPDAQQSVRAAVLHARQTART